jgi:hypothetical protein
MINIAPALRSITVSFPILALLACADSERISGVKSDGAKTMVGIAASRRLESMDDRLEALTADVPGFGGLFYDSNGRLTVYLTDSTDRLKLQDPLARFLARGNPAALSERRAEVVGMRILSARFDYKQWGGWLDPGFGWCGQCGY